MRVAGLCLAGAVVISSSRGFPVSFTGMPETVVTYLMKAFGQYMKEETPQKLNALYGLQA